jgi:HEAT repeat protein
LGFVAGSEPVVRFAWATGLVSAALSAALVLQVLRMRRRLAQRKRRREAVFARWRPLLFEVVAGDAPRLPPLAREEEDAFLLLWIQLLDGIRGAPAARLAAAGEALGAHALARVRIGGRDALLRLLALRTFGHLGRREDWGEVLRWLDDPHAYLSLAAARALVRIDPERAAEEILGRLVSRADWPVPLFAVVLADASRSRLSARLGALCAALPPPALVRLLPLASLADEAVVHGVLGPLLDPAQDPEVLAAALRHVRTPALLPAVRRAALHEAWSVRVQAATALGRVGEACDRERLLPMLRDPEWWVRYRAAQALAARPFATPDEIVAMAAQLGDRFAHDIAIQALAEARE